jgi:membrane-associated protein
LYERPNSKLFKREHLIRTHEFYEKHGGKTMVLARFIPIVRTFLNPLVGAGQLPMRTFVLWNVVGGVLWGTGVTLLGYWLGQVDVIGKNLEVFAVLVVLLSVTPMAWELRKSRRAR